MNSETELAYAIYQKNAKQATLLRDTIAELYGEYSSATRLRALKDGVLTSDEWKLVTSIYG